MSSSTGTVVFNESRIKAKSVIATESIGVGTSNPTSNLHVSGNAYMSSNLQVGTANLFVDTTTSNVGIGTTTPAYTLDVRGDIRGGCPVYFAAFCSVIQNANSTIIWDQVKEERGGGYDPSTGEFTAPIAGVYKFYYTVRQMGSASTGLWTRIQKNGTDISVGYGAIYLNTTRDQASSTILITLNAGDVIRVYLYSYSIASNYNSFVGEYFSSL